jgi:hypothetical protein
MTDQTATEATQPTAWQQTIADAIGPNMLFGLQDAKLHDGPGRQRIQEWVDWISETVAVLRDKELERLRERLRLTTDEKVAYVTGPTTDLLCEEINRLKAEVAAARKFAAEMREFCSPHGVAVDYADRLIEAMDRAKGQA